MIVSKIKDGAKNLCAVLGLDSAKISKWVRNVGGVRWFNDHRTLRLVSIPEKRKAYVIKTIRDFNPHLPNAKAAGIVRLATIWEGVGRFHWLDHANHGLNCELVHMPRATVNPAWNYFLRDYLAETRRDNSFGEYALDRYYKSRFSAARERFYNYCKAVLEDVRADFGIDVLIMPKLNDDWTIDYINAAKSIGLPVVVDDREGAITPKRLDVVPPRLRELMEVDIDLLCVHNEIHRDLFARSGVAPDKIVVNGAPQSDYWHRKDLWHSRKKIHPALRDDRFLVLFFSFGPRSYLNFYYGDEPRNWSGLCAEFHEVLGDLLKRYGSRIQIVNKSGGKPMRDQFPGHASFLQRMAPYICEDNYLELDGTYSSFDLINNANAVLGFQTSGMVEAMFRDVPIVYGAWGEFFDEIKDTLLPLHECEGIFRATNAVQLREYMEQLITTKTPWIPNTEEKRARQEMREAYFARADGGVSKRLLLQARGVAMNEGVGAARLAG